MPSERGKANSWVDLTMTMVMVMMRMGVPGPYRSVWYVKGQCLAHHRPTRALDAVAQLRKETISFVLSVCLSAWNRSVLTGRIFMKFDIRVFLGNNSKNNVY